MTKALRNRLNKLEGKGSDVTGCEHMTDDELDEAILERLAAIFADSAALACVLADEDDGPLVHRLVASYAADGVSEAVEWGEALG